MVWKVVIIESERGWGQRVDEVKEFASKAEADAFVKQFNSVNVESTAPDWYMQAQEPYEKPN